MGADGVLSPVEPASISARSQDLAKRWHDAGQFYFGHRDLWLQQPEILQCAEAYEMDSWRVQDIDTEEDWRRAEMIFRLIMQESHDRK
jgi:N-acylneuraminate cytidylyltransferase